MSIKRVMFDTVVILMFFSGIGLVFNYLLGLQISNPLLSSTVQIEEEA